MIQKLSKLVLIGAMALFFFGAVAVTVSGLTWGWVNGPVIIGGIGAAVLIVGAVAAFWIIGAAESILIRFALIFNALRRVRAETEKQEMASDYFRMDHPAAGAMAVDRAGRYFVLQPPVPTPPGHGRGDPPPTPDPLQEIEEPEVMENVMEYIADAQSLVLLGKQGSGKTTLLQHLIDYRARADSCLIIDPHGHQGKYPAGEMIGEGRNYGSIDDTFLGLLSMMNERYQQYNGQNRYQPVSVCIDEYTLLNRNCDNTAAFIESALTEWRKVKMRAILCLHSRRAKFLGLSGAMDLAEGIIFCNLKKSGKLRWAEIENDDGEVIKCYLPGAYRGGGGSAGTRPGTSGPGSSRPSWGAAGSTTTSGYNYNATTGQNTHTGAKWPFSGHCNEVGGNEVGYHPDAEPYVYEGVNRAVYEAPDSTTATVIKMYRAGSTVAEICRQVLGAAGGNQSKKVKRILSTYGLI